MPRSRTCLLIAFAFGFGCGSRTGLPLHDDVPADAGLNMQDGAHNADATEAEAPCNHDTCPHGCCEGTAPDGTGLNRHCVSGLQRSACGVGGLFCSDCGAMQCIPEGDVGGYCRQ
jgi:hypothetical protein